MTDLELSQIDSDNWVPIDTEYKPYLRIKLALSLLPFFVASLIAWFFIPTDELPFFHILPVAACLLIAFYLWGFFVWVPKRCLRMRYIVRELDISLQKGYLFWSTLSVSINRIQHLEVNQGPLQRSFGLAVLSIYTAGTIGSDLKIPGLTFGEAQRIKQALLQTINAEEAANE